STIVGRRQSANPPTRLAAQYAAAPVCEQRYRPDPSSPQPPAPGFPLSWRSQVRPDTLSATIPATVVSYLAGFGSPAEAGFGIVKPHVMSCPASPPSAPPVPPSVAPASVPPSLPVPAPPVAAPPPSHGKANP